MLVVDASALLDAFVLGMRLFDAIEPGDLHAPVTVDAEIVHALRRMRLADSVTDEIAEGILEAVRATPIARHPVQPLVSRMWQLRHNLTAYDAAYVALAESLKMPLLTRDRRLAQSSGHTARIDYID